MENRIDGLKQIALDSPYVLSQSHLEEKAGYTEIAQSAERLFEEIRESGRVLHGEVMQIAEEMMETLKKIDPSLIFQCINFHNPVDEYLKRHSVDVGFLNGLMGKWLCMEDKEIERLVVTGLVHDVGKTKIPKAILDTPRRLTLAEFEVVKMHPQYTYELLNMDDRFTEDIKQAVLQHHEKTNGEGYPSGLRADDISLFGRITAISDIYDAMVSERCYKNASSPFKILGQLVEQKFSELDTHLVKIFTDNMPNELVGKPILLSDGSIGTVKYIMQGELEYPIVEVNGEIKKTNEQLFCKQIMMDAKDDN